MAEGVTISQLPQSATALETDLIEIERGGQSYKVALGELGSALGLDEFVEQILDVLG